MVCVQKKLSDDLCQVNVLKQSLNMHRIEKTQGIHHRLDDYDSKKYSAKKKKLREDLSIDEKVFVLAERIKKKSAQKSFTNSLCKI